MLSMNSWIKNQKIMEEADERATKITNQLLFKEPMSYCTAMTVEIYEKQRIWMAKYMEERARITREITGCAVVDAVKDAIKKPESPQPSAPKVVPRFGYGAYAGMYDD